MGFQTEMEKLITLEELVKYLRVFTLSENSYEKREFALELLIKLEKGYGSQTIKIPAFGANQENNAAPSVEQAPGPSLDNSEFKVI